MGLGGYRDVGGESRGAFRSSLEKGVNECGLSSLPSSEKTLTE